MSTQTSSDKLAELEAQLANKNCKLLRSEEEIIKLTKLCADLMNKDLKSTGDGDSWSLGSGGADADVEQLKEKLMKLKQNEEYLNAQLEVLQSTIKIMIHPDDIESREKGYKSEISLLTTQVEQLLAANMSMKLDISQIDELKSESRKLSETDETKTRLIEELHEKLARYDEQQSALLESLSETERSEQSLRDSLTRIKSSEKLEVVEDTEEKVVESDRAQLLQRLDSLEEKDARLRDRLQQVEEQEQTQEVQLENLREELQLTKDINSSQEQTIVDLQQQIEDLASSDERKKQELKISELEKKCSNMKLLLSQKMEELEFSRKSITSLEKSVTELQTSCGEMDRLQQELKSVDEELNLAKDINSSQEETIRQLQTQTGSTDADLAQSYHQQLTHQLSAEDVEEMQAEYQQETKLLKEEIDKLNKKIDEFTESHQQQLSSSQAKIANLEKDMSKSASKLQIAQNLIDELKGQNKKLTHDGKGDYDEKIKDLNMKLQGEKVQNSVHRDVIASMSPQIEKLKCENESLESKLNSLNDKLNVSETELSKKKSESEALKSRSQLLEKKLEENSEHLSRLESSQTSPSELADVTQRLETKTVESDNLAVDLIQLTDRCSELEKQLNSANALLQSEQAARNDLQNSCNNLKTETHSLQVTTKNVEAQLATSETELSDVHQRLVDMEEKYQAEVTRTEKLQVSLERENERLRERELHEHQSVGELQALVVVAAKDLQQIEGEKDMLVEALNSTKSKLNALIVTKDEGQQEVNQLTEQISKYQMQVANLDSELKRANKTNDAMVASLKNQIYSLTQDKSALQSRNDKLVIEVDKILSEKQVYIDEIEKLASELKQRKSSHANELTKKQEIVAELNEKLDAYKTLKQQNDSYAEGQAGEEEQRNLKVNELSAANHTLQTELLSVKLELLELSQDRDALQKRVIEQDDSETKYETLCEDYEEQKLLVAELSNAADQARSVNCTLKLQVSDEQAKSSTLLQEIKSCEAELRELKQSVEEERNKGIFLANKQADKHKMEIAALQEVMLDVCAERDELKKQASKSTSEKTSETEHLKSQIEVLTKDKDWLKSNLDSLQNEQLEQLSSSSAKASILQAQLDNMKDQMEKEKKLAHNLKSLSTELQAQLREERNAHSITNEQLQTIKSEQLTFKEQVEDLKEKHEHCQQRCEEVEADVKLLEQQLGDRCSENEHLSEQLAQAKAEMQQLQSAAETQANVAMELETFKLLLTDKKTECSELLSQNDSIQKQLSADEEKVRELSDQLSSLQLQLDMFKSDSLEQSNLDDLKSQLGNQIAVSNLAKAAASLRLQPGASSLSEEQTDSQDDYIDALQSEIEMLTSQLSSTKKENDDLSAHVSDLDEQLSSASLLTNEIEHLREKYVDAVASCDLLRDQLTAANIKSDKLCKELEGVNTEELSAQKKMELACTKLEKEKDALVAEVNLLRDKLANLETSQEIDNLEDCTDSSSSSSSGHGIQRNEINDEPLSVETRDEFTYDSANSSAESENYRTKYQLANEQVESLEAKLQEAVSDNTGLSLEISTLKSERDQLSCEVSQMVSAEQYTSLQSELFELKQKLNAETKRKQSLEKSKESFEENLTAEKQALKESEMEVQKLQMSISLLMTSHETEMTSLQAALSDADCKMKDLEDKVVDYSSRGKNLDSVVEKLNAELHSLKTSKEMVCQLMNDLVVENSKDSIAFQQQLIPLLQRVDISDEDMTSDLSTSLPVDQPLQSSLADADLMPVSSSPVHNMTSSMNISSLKSEPLPTVSNYSQLSKADLVAKLSDQTKHELILRKHLEEARQSLAFYRSAIDNIIDCLGTAMPSVKKWANDVLNYEDQAFSQQLDALISNESALQRRCHALEISEKALTESIATKEQEYQLAIHRLEDMVSILKSSKAKLLEELKLKATNLSTDAEQQIASLKQEVYELEGSVRKLKIQNEEMQFAYEQECERRQVEEEERCRADQRSRLSTIETVRESEYLAKISSLETKISGLMSTQNELEGRIDNFKHNGEEEELKQRIATVERSERALLRKIEILQQTDGRGSSTQYDNSLDKPEDLLRQKIWEMEKMEIHLKQQVSDLEHDREELHEIARSDKNTIHELNIQLAELSLTSKNLKAQLARVEQAEEVVCTKLETAESHIVELEEKLKETLNNEKTMRLQLTDVEYSEDSLRFHTDTVERSLDTLQASETSLRSTIDDLTNERQQAVKETASWKARFNELEGDHSMLRGQLVESKNREITLKGKISELAATEASLQTRIREVELQNESFKNEVLHLKKSATGIRESLSDTLMGKDELNNRIQSMKSMDEHTKSRVAELEEEKFEMEKKLQDVNIKYVQLQSQQNIEEIGQSRFSERLSAALANEKKARDNVVRLEAVVAAYESRQTSGIVERENFQLNAENKNLKDKLKMKERDLKDLEEKVNRLTAAGNTGGGTYRINKLQGQVKDLQAQLLHSEQARSRLEDMLEKMGTDSRKGSCGHDAEITAMKTEMKRLKAANDRPFQRYGEMSNTKEPMKATTQTASVGSNNWSTGADESLRKKCLTELVNKVNEKNASDGSGSPERIADGQPKPTAGDADSAVSDDDAAEIASQSSIWEKLEPPVRQSPRPLMSAHLKPCSPPPSPAGKESADEASDLEEITVPPLQGYRQESPNGNGSTGKEETAKEQTGSLSLLAVQTTDTKDVIRLKQTITDLERRLKSRETEIRMLRNGQKEIERESNLSGDLYTMKTKLRALQDQVDSGDRKITQLREELISRDKSLTNKQREVVDLRLELSKLQQDLASKPKPREGSAVSAALSPNSLQRPIQTEDLARLEKELVSLKVEAAPPTDSSSLRFKYLDEKYTEAATKCYKMKQERDEWKEKYDRLMEEHSQCQQPITGKCQKCRQLKAEIRRLQKELRACKDQLVDKMLGRTHASHRTVTHDDEGDLSSNTVDAMSSLSEDTLNGHSNRPFVSAFAHVNGNTSHSLNSSSKPPAPPIRYKPFQARDYEAISDYNPRYFSTSGRVAQETSLKRGQIVKVLEQADDTGYCKAEVDGRIYLVPLKYLQIMDATRVAARGNITSTQLSHPQQTYKHTRAMTAHLPLSSVLDSQSTVPRARSSSPTKYTTDISSAALSGAGISSAVVSGAGISSAALSGAGISSAALSGADVQPTAMSQKQTRRKPQPPTHLRAEVVATQKLYIEWAYVQYLDHATRSNGTSVIGFRVFLNGRAIKDIDSAYTTVTSIDLSLDQLSDLHTISVQALGAANVNSTLVHVTFSPSIDSIPSSSNHKPKSKCEVNGKQGTKRLFIAYYDYDPNTAAGLSQAYKSSHRDKLTLKTGDFIVTYGQPKPNGFYLAEVNGKTGYVPEAFIRQVPTENAKRFGFLDNDVSLH